MVAPVQDTISKPELVATDDDFTKDNTHEVGRTNIPLQPHESYEGAHRWDPEATWTPEEEARVVRKTDLRLLTWLCLMFFGLQLDRGTRPQNATKHDAQAHTDFSLQATSRTP